MRFRTPWALLFLTTASPAVAQCPTERLEDASVIQNDELGITVAKTGDFVFVGSRDSSQFASAGAVSVFQLESSGYVLKQKLFSGKPYATNFGAAIAADGQRVVIGAPGSNFAPGFAYVFELRPEGWLWTQELAPSDGDNDWDFGMCLALYGDRILVGSQADHGRILSSGAAYLYEHSTDGWQEVAKLFSEVPTLSEAFGAAVALGDGFALIGLEFASGALPETGAVKVFEPTPSGWVETAKVFADDGGPFHRFGNAVAVDGEVMVVGADGANNSVGRAYVFERDAGVWSQTATLLSDAAFSGSLFGDTVAVSGNQAVVAGPSFAFPGIVALFERSGTTWREAGQIESPISGPLDRFGAGLWIEEGLVLVGSPGKDGPLGRGTAYAYTTLPPYDRLQAAESTLSISTGGAQQLRLNSCLEFAGGLYWVLGSTGTSGLPFGAASLPLSLDAYFLSTLLTPNSGTLKNSLGLLDPQAKGKAALRLPAGLGASLVGTTLHHAYGVLDPVTLEPLAASNALAVQLVP